VAKKLDFARKPKRRAKRDPYSFPFGALAPKDKGGGGGSGGKRRGGKGGGS
jgi:hypothetical protein